jgi:redox-regulated HSP33 family molecular chaperone
MDAVMRSLGRKQVNDLLAEQVAEGKPAELEICCRFCNTRYTYKKAELDCMDFVKE